MTIFKTTRCLSPALCSRPEISPFLFGGELSRRRHYMLRIKINKKAGIFNCPIQIREFWANRKLIQEA